MQSHATSPAELVKFVLLKAAGAQRAEAARQLASSTGGLPPNSPFIDQQIYYTYAAHRRLHFVQDMLRTYM